MRFMLNLTLIVGLTLAQIALAKDQVSNECKFSTLINIKGNEAFHHAMQYNQERMKLLQESITLAGKAKNPNKTIYEQLNADEKIKFTELNEKIDQLKIQLLIASRRARELELIKAMNELAKKEVEGNKIPTKKENTYFVYRILEAARLLYPISKLVITPPSTQTCSLEHALYLDEEAIIKKQNLANLPNVMSEYNQIRAKYNTELLDNYAPEDKQRILELKENIHHFTYISDLENIRLMLRSLDVILEANTNETNIEPSTSLSLGSPLKRLIENNQIADNIKIAIIFWILLQDRYPSAFEIQFEKEAPSY